ncbi:hypothetical protein BD414DRAFT_430165 [Trametes punicea]|nr:hypothetical protein BD414DRAFT_430165 [Trametes punicea]
MALFSASESVYLSSFLSSVDLDSSITNDGHIDPGLADQIPAVHGSEALAKATKELMSLDVPVTSAASHASTAHTPNPHLHPSATSPPSYWPSLPPGAQPSSSSSSSAHARFAQPARSSSPVRYVPRSLSGTIAPSDSLRSSGQVPSALSSDDSHQRQHQHHQVAPASGFTLPSSSSSSTYTLPPISTAGFPNGLSSHEGSRPPAIPSAASAPSILTQQQNGGSTSTSTSTKRPLPPSSEPATDPSSSKRARQSPSSSSFPSVPEIAESASTTAAAPPCSRLSTSSASAAAPQQSLSSPITNGSAHKEKAKEKEKTKGTGGSEGGGGGSGGSKGALLSPSQKRANHIQSEQKRRANIRRGYEALCEVVPALREAIRAEEGREHAAVSARGEREDEGAEHGVGPKGKGRAVSGDGREGTEKGRKKRKGESEKPDGRAGPRSENVVLQKTIDYITSLLADRAALTQRLQIARGVLPLGHPATHVDPRHLDARGVPLWEREWNGDMDLDAGAPDDGSEDEG